MSETVTPSNLVFTVLHLLLDEIDMDTLLAHAELPAQRLLDTEGAITASEMLRLYESARVLTGDPALALHLGLDLGSEMLDLVGMMISTAPDLRAAILSAIQYSALLTTMGHSELREDGDDACVVLHLLPEMGPYALHGAELVYSFAWGGLRRLVVGDARLRRITFTEPAPPWADEYPQIFGEETDITFGAPLNTIVFPRSCLDLPMARHTPGLYRHLQEQAAMRLARQPQPETTCASAKRLIEEHLGEHQLDLATLAQHMGLSPRTLQRRLKDEGTTFLALHDACRLRVARQELLERNTDIATIADRLGYCEPTNFYRSFKAWTGMSPSEYRRRHRP